MMTRVLVVDDEPLARKRLCRMLEEIDGYEVIAQAGNGIEAVEKQAELEPDIVFMDIRMPGMDGLQAARHIANSETAPAMVFCTAYDEYALSAFESNAVGYLLKPASRAGLVKALEQAGKVNRMQAMSLRDTDPAGSTSQRTHVSASSPHGVKLVAVDEVRAFIADHRYVTAIHGEGELLLDDTLKELESEFAGRFVRIHRNALVSPDFIRGIERQEQGGYAVVLADVELKPGISRRHLAEVRRLIKTL
jgi:two-component system response regulator AlgR